MNIHNVLLQHDRGEKGGGGGGGGGDVGAGSFRGGKPGQDI